ncbi:protein PHOTOPERIOD-INDEPENDENT EARLY FLOWERING 1 isoform X1 [Asparagus officinalis]|uniref:protein PHOTOPERIOD-INDEPENDENT EARLY FLOWERING 1 isoform X1 n=1 Tax=Asparagus officinalis TaxID=4686 RepID=UPI00098DFB20|nr:protein PHOTOPERIOD-INDEPENDENT EARLY FLOWERING 1 isoform X1 [Asparagus officinalis]
MASKGPRSKVEHESRSRRQKALEAPREPPRPKAHWDHVLEEMVWLSKDFESERKWKLAQAKRVAIRASKSFSEHATRGEKKVKEEEQKLRKVALNISKDVKKFWLKIEKLVLYKHQLELEEKKKKALDKQLDFLLGQTERYSTMLAENLVDIPTGLKPLQIESGVERENKSGGEEDKKCLIETSKNSLAESDSMELDDDFGIRSEDDVEDDEKTIEEDEIHITEDERREELIALQAEVDLPLEELLNNYTKEKVSREVSPEGVEDVADHAIKRNNQIKGSVNQQGDNNHVGPYLEGHFGVQTRRSKLAEKDSNTLLKGSVLTGAGDDPDDRDYVLIGEEKDDEETLSEEEELAKGESDDPLDEIGLLQKESEMPVEELLARYRKEDCADSTAELDSASSDSDDEKDSAAHHNVQLADPDLPTDASSKQDVSSDLKDMDIDMQVVDNHNEISDKKGSEDIIADAAAAARSAQPTGNTFSTTKVRTKFPFLLKHSLREYQHIGLDWLVTMYEKRLNGILADEMGLGKTIMTISLLAHLACEKGIWGPHLIVVPTSVMLNWETEFLKWCPAFKILTYFGSAKERKHKRQGWMKPNSFHICITTYRLVIQDSKIFKRKKWKYLILDEAHLIKNWKSQRWQTLLNFNSKRRILLTGTPLQNDLMELWSLMHFLMPHIFQSHQEFKDWFCNPIAGMVEGQDTVNKEVVDRLHNVLRPFILRRLKRDVEKQLPKKYEHVIYCRLSRRQRNLYEDFIASSETQATLASSNFFGMISVIMQLRKVCNHPDLFEGRPIVSSLDLPGIDMQLSSPVCTVLSSCPFSQVDLKGLNLVFTHLDFTMTSWEVDEIASNSCPINLFEEKIPMVSESGPFSYVNCDRRRNPGGNIFEEIHRALCEERLRQLKERAAAIEWWNSLRCQKQPVYGTNLRELVTVQDPVFDLHKMKNSSSCYLDFSSKLAAMVLSPVERLQEMLDLVESFMFAIPASRAPPPSCWCSKRDSPIILQSSYVEKCTEAFSPLLTPIRPAIVRRQVYFPDRRLIQFDCGKLQELSVLLRHLKSDGHRALIFTQMTKMLDILEAFINLYGYTYMRLDGSTPPEERQTLMQRFNTNPKYFLFILSTRSGGVGINLVGADTVIFYDSDWNPAMDQQAQDRCHRIGQTREVHIYRLISESTIEENILKKANQKRMLDDLVIQSGSYNTDFFKKLDPLDIFSGHGAFSVDKLHESCSNPVEGSKNDMAVLSNDDVEAAIKQAEDEADYMALKRVEQEEAVDNQEFTEEVVGKMDEDEFLNDDDIKADEKTAEEESWGKPIANKDKDASFSENNKNEAQALTVVGDDDDIDMLADVKQMAAAASAAGQASSSFENHLRPIDRYAMRFLDLWDPIIDKSAIEYEVNMNAEEWELDRIEKFKEDLEAEIDEDQEPLLYERWDADFATKAYRERVEALAQQQLLDEQESDAQDTDKSYEALRNVEIADRKSKSKKRPKKTKFKSLKKGPLASEMGAASKEIPVESDDDDLSLEMMCMDSPPRSPPKKKRKKVVAEPEEQKNSRKSLKKLKKAPDWKLLEDSNSSFMQLVEAKESRSVDGVNDFDLKSNRSKVGSKISITAMPIKRVMVVKPERFKRKTNVWSKDCFPPPDSWSSQEDAMLCAIVHEYGTHWALASDAIYSMPAGGFYRGWFRHPVHCCERFRELVLKYVFPAADGSNVEKNTLSGSGKALLRVTEDQAHTLLNIAMEQPDAELHLQKHFLAVLSSVWKAKCCLERRQSTLHFRNGFYSSSLSSQSFGKMKEGLTGNIDLKVLRQSSKLVLAALLSDVSEKHHEEPSHVITQLETQTLGDQVDITVDFLEDHGVYEAAFPSSITLSVYEPESQVHGNEFHGETLLAESSCRIAQTRLRLASEACIDGEGTGWASSAFSSCSIARNRAGGKSQALGKHKSSSDSSRQQKSKVQKIAESYEDSLSLTKSFLPSPRLHIDDFPSVNLECGIDYHSLLPSDESLLLDMPSSEFMPEEYDPEFLTGLEDLGSLQDITDVG